MPVDIEATPATNTASLVREIVADLHLLVEQELLLARKEIGREINYRLRAATLLIAGAVLSFLGLISTCFAVAHLLHWVASTPTVPVDPSKIPLWGCHAIVAVVLLVIGITLASIGRGRISRRSAPEESESS